MAVRPDTRFQARTDSMTRAGAEAAQIDVGLRQYMLRVYNYMALGVALHRHHRDAGRRKPGDAASGRRRAAEVGVVRGHPGPGLLRPEGDDDQERRGGARVLLGICGDVGRRSSVPCSIIYTQGSIARAFFITAAAFAGMSLFGYTTKRDLSAVGRFLVMATSAS